MTALALPGRRGGGVARWRRRARACRAARDPYHLARGALPLANLLLRAVARRGARAVGAPARRRPGGRVHSQAHHGAPAHRARRAARSSLAGAQAANPNRDLTSYLQYRPVRPSAPTPQPPTPSLTL